MAQLYLFVVMVACLQGSVWSNEPERSRVAGEVDRYMAEKDWQACGAICMRWADRNLADRLELIHELALRLESTKKLELGNLGPAVVASRPETHRNPGLPEMDPVSGDPFIEGGRAADAIFVLLDAPGPIPDVN